jgi:hypothetical protein
VREGGTGLQQVPLLSLPFSSAPPHDGRYRIVRLLPGSTWRNRERDRRFAVPRCWREGDIVTRCLRGHERQSIPILDLPLPKPPPAGAEWIEAYRYWARGR